MQTQVTTPKIRVINPNTSASMTDLIERCARGVVAAGTSVDAVNPSMGPASIESHYDEALAVPGLLEEIRRGDADGVQGYVIACFGDPGLDAARELARGPVIGIAEAAMHTASFLGRRFSVVTTLDRTIGRAEDLAAHYGMARFCGGYHACDIPVLELESDPAAQQRITDACAAALESDGSEVIVLGCAGMADLCEAISKQLGVPVIDGVAAATVLVEGLVRLGLRTSDRGEFAHPLPKSYSGALKSFTIEP
ncbi:aspartate/glutamate racemase family protein [Millisia brevis]|uniref:aspartate/glutamate racemase family protein n=1 Tax=Millisia brevis TaxID=264148 RepID=UPI000A826664|nr:aspartate/glutamate racemase family protein [Millisia brevis]